MAATAPRCAALSSYVLTVLGGGRSPLPATGEVMLGRDPSCGVRLADPTVSRRHAAIAIIGGAFEIRDLGSTHGTFLGGAAIGALPMPIAPDQVVRLGDVALVIERARPTSPSGAAPAMDRVRALLERVARGSISVLILGETGVGKEVMAELVHARSARAGRPLVRLNCAALSETLLESELFGHEKGAFTGALAAKCGLLESADGGTVFLDEIGELPMATQVRLLRVLEQREVQRVGALTPRAIDVRFVAATHRDLHAEIAAGRFRQDLYFRLNGMTIVIPPLRERLGELDALIARFGERAAGRAVELTSAARGVLHAHRWPGNIRELRNVVERAVLLAGDEAIDVDHLILDDHEPPASAGGEREQIVAALTRAAGNQKVAAELLGISRRTLLNKLDAYAIARPRKSAAL